MNPLLKMAVLAGSGKAVSLNLNRMTNLNSVDEKGMSLLMLAASRGYSEICRILLAAGVDPLLLSMDGLSALCLAKANGHLDTAHMISCFMDVIPEEPEPSQPNVNYDALPDAQSVKNDLNPASLGGWDEEPDAEIPENDHSLFARAGDIQDLISSYRPNDLDDDWTDIHVDLPEFTWFHPEAYLQHDWLPIERKFFLHGIKTGRLVSSQVEDMAEFAEDEDGYEERLRGVLSDLGIRIDELSCDYVHPCCLEDLGLGDDEPEVQLAEEAIRFLWEKNNPAHDPYWIYMRDVRRFPILKATEEIDLCRQAEDGGREILHAALFFHPVVPELIAMVKATGWNSIAGTMGHGEQEGVITDDDGFVGDFDVENHKIDICGGLNVSNYDSEQQRIELRRRIEIVSDLYAEFTKISEVAFPSTEECLRLLRLIHDELAEIRFSTKILFRLVEVMRSYRKRIQDSIDRIYLICTKAGVEHESFLELFSGHETNIDWCRNVIDVRQGRSSAEITRVRSEILKEQMLLVGLEKEIRLPLQKFVELCDRVQAGEETMRHAHYRMTVSNLRFSHYIALKYQRSSLFLTDLVQEANVGLLKAVERFDYRRGFRFSTFASWWIRQSVTRAISDKSRLIRLPAHVDESLFKFKRAVNKLEARGGQVATPEDIAGILELPLEKVLKIISLPGETLSFEALDEENPGFIETLLGREGYDPELKSIEESCSEAVASVLCTLSRREEKILRLRFGIGEDAEYTLEEIGKRYNVTRERIRQIEKKALKRLRHKSRSKILQAFI